MIYIINFLLTFQLYSFTRWVVGIWLVMKLSSDDLLDRLKKKGTRDPTYTKELIIGKLNDNDADVATTSLKVTVSCPLGKMRMRVSLVFHEKNCENDFTEKELTHLCFCRYFQGNYFIITGPLSSSNMLAFTMF